MSRRCSKAESNEWIDRNNHKNHIDMKTLKLLIATMLALAATVAASASPAIFKNGKSRYVIAVAAEASVSELTAAP